MLTGLVRNYFDGSFRGGRERGGRSGKQPRSRRPSSRSSTRSAAIFDRSADPPRRTSATTPTSFVSSVAACGTATHAFCVWFFDALHELQDAAGRLESRAVATMRSASSRWKSLEAGDNDRPAGHDRGYLRTTWMTGPPPRRHWRTAAGVATGGFPRRRAGICWNCRINSSGTRGRLLHEASPSDWGAVSGQAPVPLQVSAAARRRGPSPFVVGVDVALARRPIEFGVRRLLRRRARPPRRPASRGRQFAEHRHRLARLRRIGRALAARAACATPPRNFTTPRTPNAGPTAKKLALAARRRRRCPRRSRHRSLPQPRSRLARFWSRRTPSPMKRFFASAVTFGLTFDNAGRDEAVAEARLMLAG